MHSCVTLNFFKRLVRVSVSFHDVCPRYVTYRVPITDLDVFGRDSTVTLGKQYPSSAKLVQIEAYETIIGFSFHPNFENNTVYKVVRFMGL